MKNDEVIIGGHYKAKVSDKLTTVRIDAENPRGGWDATNLITNKKVRIKSAQRLRGKASVPGDGLPQDRPRDADEPSPADAPTDTAAADTGEQGETGGKRKKKTTKKPSPNTPPWAKQKDREAAAASTGDGEQEVTVGDDQQPKAKRGRKRSGTSLLDAAITVMRENHGPMTCSQMIEQILEKELWSTSGKTPAATLYSAILREIQKKGDGARFTHVERGKFDLTDAGRENKED